MKEDTTIVPPHGVIDLHELISQIFKSLGLIIAFAAVFAVMGFLFAMRPIPYEVHATLNVEPVAIDGVLATSSINLDTEIGRIRSWTTVDRVLEKMQRNGIVTLKNSPDMPDKWGKVILFLKTGKKHQEMERLPIKVGALKFPERLNNKALTLNVGHQGRYKVHGSSGELLFDGKVGDDGIKAGGDYLFAVKEINVPADSVFAILPYSRETIIEKVIMAMKVKKRASAQKSSLIDIQFFWSEPYFALRIVQGLMEDYVRNAYERLAATKHKAIADMEVELQEIKQELNDSETELGDFMKNIDVADIESEMRGQMDLRLSVESSLRQVQLQIAQLKQVYTAGHPAMKAAAEKEQKLQRKLAQITERLGSLPEIKGKLFTLTRKVEQASAKYDSILEQYALLKASASSVSNYASIVNEQRIARHNLRNKTIQVVVLAGLMGAIIAISFVVLASNVFSNSLKNIEQIRNDVGISIYDLDMPHPDEDVLEEVVSQFAYIASKKKNNITAITSDKSCRRKSELTAEMAKKFSDKKGKTLLIDANIKESKLIDILELEPKKGGFANVMIEKMPASEVIQRVDKSNLYFMGSGMPSMSLQILRDFDRFEYLLQQFGKVFDRIIIDLPAQRDLPFWQTLITRAGTVVHFYEKSGHLDHANHYLFSLGELMRAKPDTLHELVLFKPPAEGNSLLSRLFKRA